MANVVSKFGFVIKAVENEQGIITKTEVLNQGIPQEFIITKMRAYIKQLEDNYYGHFEVNSPEE